MRIEQRDSGDERRILIGLITDPLVLGAVADKWPSQGGLFESKWANLVAHWCIRYHGRYGAAPGERVSGLYESWVSKGRRDKATVGLVERFLTSLSEEYAAAAEDSNTAYLIDLAGSHFNRVRLRRLAEGVQGDLDSGDVEAAERRLTESNRVELGVGTGIDVLGDKEAIRQAFETAGDPLIVYPGALGEFFGNALERDGFVSFMAPEKRAKTWWLIDVAWRGLLQRKRVAFFQIGDLSQNQIMRRFMVRAARRPQWATKPAHPVLYPTKITRPQGAITADVEREPRHWKGDLSWQEAYQRAREVMRSKVRSKEKLLNLSVHPNDTIGVQGIAGILHTWARHGWVADVVVIDYADLLTNPPGVKETRDGINQSWKQLRRLSQQLHCLVVTATQSDANSYGVRNIGRKNFSEDKRKLSHPTAMITINADDEEYQNQICRLRFIANREAPEGPPVYVASCLSIGNPAVRSTW